MHALKLLRLPCLPIFEQLVLEEALLRATTDNWFIVNHGLANHRPTIVLGVSGKPTELLHLDKVQRDDIPLIRRFSGGGTVITDENTIFTTFIINKSALPEVQLYPRPIMAWTGEFYKKVFGTAFSLRENDYCFGDKKFAGNAQTISRERWLHHTSFLWDYQSSRMQYLQLPKKQPEYRQLRGHDHFLCRLKDFVQSKEAFGSQLLAALHTYFVVEDVAYNPQYFHEILKRPHISSTTVVDVSEHLVKENVA
eukprot:GILJ01003261.1.p1 GENE.GILJ01003261.1~~GILJ01003261.1.p1  ORF type:complete len:252 (+),score=33.48 GILJ01003261.1:26-781(+)